MDAAAVVGWDPQACRSHRRRQRRMEVVVKFWGGGWGGGVFWRSMRCKDEV